MIVHAFTEVYRGIDKDEKCIFINGVFDIFHLYHLKMINYAKRTFPNHKLVMAINSDKSVMEMNKKHPLIFDVGYRSQFLAELSDLVVIYDNFYDYLEIIKDFRPDFIIKGSEYKNKDIPEKNLPFNIIYYHGEEMSSTKVYQQIIDKFRRSTEI